VSERVRDLFPQFTVNRGGIRYPRPGTPEWAEMERQHEVASRLRAQTDRHIQQIIAAQDQAIGQAALDAAELGLDVHIHPPTLRQLENELDLYPTIHRHDPTPERDPW
jgi:hypothetical protein